MRKLFALIVTAGVLGIAAAVHAGGHNDAGCGVGAMIFKDNTKGQQILAATTNQYFPQSSSITSGTSGCTPDAVAMRRQEREIFVAVNFRSLARELAFGKGEFASSFATLMGCTDASAFLSHTKEHYGELFPAEGTTPEQLLNSVENQVAADSGLSQVCTL